MHRRSSRSWSHRTPLWTNSSRGSEGFCSRLDQRRSRGWTLQWLRDRLPNRQIYLSNKFAIGLHIELDHRYSYHFGPHPFYHKRGNRSGQNHSPSVSQFFCLSQMQVHFQPTFDKDFQNKGLRPSILNAQSYKGSSIGPNSGLSLAKLFISYFYLIL